MNPVLRGLSATLAAGVVSQFGRLRGLTEINLGGFAGPLLACMVPAAAGASPVPVCIYHRWKMPTPFEVVTVGSIAEHPTVAALKDTSGDPLRLAAILEPRGIRR